MAETSELNEKIWAVVDWKGIKATDLTYASAIDVVDAMKIINGGEDPSLCVITAEAASRIKGD